MRTTCPTCDTAYAIPDERIGAKGRKVRCTRCGEEWRVFLATEEVSSEVSSRTAAGSARLADPSPDLPPARSAPPLVDAPGVDDEITFAGPSPAAEPSPSPVRDPEAVAAEAADPADDAPPVADDAGTPAAAATPDRPAGRVRIRTHRRLPQFGRQAVAHLAARIRPFVGPTVFLAACLTLTGVYVFRQAIVAVAPDLAGLYAALGAPVNLRGLVFGRIETLREIDNGQPVLVVEGSIANVTPQMREVPALRFALRGADTQELYAWSVDPRSTTIESGDTIRFRTRLAAPPEQATEVQVRFVERRSQQAGLP
mgnify:CR=1 FL=1